MMRSKKIARSISAMTKAALYSPLSWKYTFSGVMLKPSWPVLPGAVLLLALIGAGESLEDPPEDPPEAPPEDPPVEPPEEPPVEESEDAC